MARRSCPLEGFEQCDTDPDGPNELNRRLLALPDSWDPVRHDLFSKSPFTKHCKWGRGREGLIPIVIDHPVGSITQAEVEVRARVALQAPKVWLGRV
jgi:hypothetical protein